MNNNELFNKFKRKVAIYNFDQEYNNSSKARIYPIKKEPVEAMTSTGLILLKNRYSYTSDTLSTHRVMSGVPV